MVGVAAKMQFGRVGAVALGLILGVLAGWGVAQAATSNSDPTDFTSNGVSYLNTSGMSNSGTTTYSARTSLFRLSSGDAPVGRIGARARAYWSNGTLCERTATRYNTVKTRYFDVYMPKAGFHCGGYVYARGFTETWNGNGYKRVATKRTANVLY